MSEPTPPERPQPLTVLCPECGDIIEIRDPQTFLMSLHQANECSLRSLVSRQPDD